MTELDKGLIDKQTYYKTRRYEDPSTIMKGILKDMIYNDPAIQEQLIINAIREEGFGEMADQRQADLDQQNLERMTPPIGAGGQRQPPGVLPGPASQPPSGPPMTRSLPQQVGPDMTQAMQIGGGM